MSLKAMVWAFDQKCPSPAAKLVLLKLADHCDEEGVCWPSHARVGEDCGIDRTTVIYHVKKLVAAGLVVCERQFRDNGGKTATRYTLAMAVPAPMLAPPTPHVDDTDIPMLASPTPHVDGVNMNLPDNQPKITFPPLPPRKPGGSLAGFEDWWREYPHKVGKGAAERAWPKALSLASAGVLSAAVRRYVDTKPPDRPWCNPATWLNQRRWEDEADGSVREGGYDGPTGPAPSPEELRRLVAGGALGLAH